jgi:hypothetical protein
MQATRSRVSESADIGGDNSPPSKLPVGLARPINDPNLPTMTEKATDMFIDAHAGRARSESRSTWSIPAGCVPRIVAQRRGRIGGCSVVELRFVWRKGRTLEADASTCCRGLVSR